MDFVHHQDVAEFYSRHAGDGPVHYPCEIRQEGGNEDITPVFQKRIHQRSYLGRHVHTAHRRWHHDIAEYS